MTGATQKLAELKQFFGMVRFPLNDEKKLQAAMQEHLDGGGRAFTREHVLGPGDVVDFMVDGIAVEVKIKGQRRAIYRQCKRYAAHEAVEGLLLITNVAMGFPEDMEGKPTAVLNLGRAWL
ncbi:hypothetical protein [Ancylobacter radicis]|uniref:Uncharacterized protein n=1 Tax=Ancylobacter radicis TaxID=2836179 RepID=A0ABS5R600_9HYPH|nr:hypothetical protein [Ancylobacter radicis]MBS9476219.1 hypothetical protein [Ancylobacter radicis]